MTLTGFLGLVKRAVLSDDMKKKVDPRIRQTLEDAVANNHRALMVLVGDKARDQVVNLHYMLSRLTLSSRPSVLWCYKKELGFSSNKKKRMKVIKRRIKQGLVDPDKDDPFELFISSTTIRFAYYSESRKILGNTYGMCILQDFEALTPNLLARTIETVQGGGLILLLIHTMSSLKQLFSLTMDVHARLRTEAHSFVVPRFNERFILSLADCPAAIVADDELNVLPISSHVRALTGQSGTAGNGNSAPVSRLAPATPIARSTSDAEDLTELKKTLADTQPVGPLVEKARTIDQAKALLRFEEALSEKTLRTTVALTASRGRGKSAALGLAVAAAIAHDYSNIFVTSPSPENLRTFFAFLFVGFDALGMNEHTDYEIIQSTDPALNKAVIRVNVFKAHRQTVQYVDPTDAPRFLSQAELVIIDEAAAIPLPAVEAMLGPYVVFMSSTVTGYEGTGRSLSLKLIKKLREGGSQPSTTGNSSAMINGPSNRESDRQATAVAAGTGAGRVFYEVHMETPIRYSDNDPIEAWLYDLLCLHAGGVRQALTTGAPHPNECELYYVERDALFSRHNASEAFLQRIVALFVSSHYKNSPNDLQMLSDAPAHGLFVLLAPTGANSTTLPDVLVAIQVCLEGRISATSSKSQLGRGIRASGDLIPWTISQQFQEPEFATLSGVRIVRIATHPDLQGMGYGSRAMRLLMNYYDGKMMSLEADDGAKDGIDADFSRKEKGGNELGKEGREGEATTLLNEIIGPRKNIPPLLRRLHERSAEPLDYMGVSFGLTQGLYKFWSKLGFLPLYLRLTANELTGEHTCIMAKLSGRDVENDEKDANDDWLDKFHQDFRRRFVYLLGFDFRKFDARVAMAILKQQDGFWDDTKGDALRFGDGHIKSALNVFDRRRLESYSRSLVDYHVIVDLLPKLAELHAMGAFDAGDSAVRLSPAQCAILVALGLQKKRVDDLEKELSIESSQVLALLNKIIRKLAKWLREKEEAEVAQEIGDDEAREKVHKRLQTVTKDDEGAQEEEDIEGKQQQNSKLTVPGSEEDGAVTPSLQRFRIGVSDGEWDKALSGVKDGAIPSTVSFKANKRKDEDVGKIGAEKKHSAKKKRRKV